MIQKHPTFFVALAGVTAAAFLVLRLQSEPPMPPPPIDPPAKPYASSLAASGIIEALSENVSVGVPEAGVVTRVHVRVWDNVREGQPLFSLDAREIEAQLAVDGAKASVAEATLHRLQDQLARLKSVHDSRAVSAEEVRTKENDVSVSYAQLEAARALVEQDRVRLDRLTVRASRDGTILQVNIRPGEYASATPKSAAIVLGELDNLQVRAEIDEQNAVRLEAGQPAKAYVKGDTAHPIDLTFVRIEPYVVPKVSLTGSSTERVDTRVLQVIYSFKRPADRAIYVGQQVDLYVESAVPSLVLNNTGATGVALN